MGTTPKSLGFAAAVYGQALESGLPNGSVVGTARLSGEGFGLVSQLGLAEPGLQPDIKPGVLPRPIL